MYYIRTWSNQYVKSEKYQTGKPTKDIYTSAWDWSNVSSPSLISYRRCYFQNLLTSKSVVAAMLPVIVEPNGILKSKVQIREHLGISQLLRKKR